MSSRRTNKPMKSKLLKIDSDAPEDDIVSDCDDSDFSDDDCGCGSENSCDESGDDEKNMKMVEEKANVSSSDESDDEEVDDAIDRDTGEINFNPKHAKIWVFAGEPCSGKTYALTSIIYQYIKKQHFKFGLAISETAHVTGDLDFIPEKHRRETYDEDQLKAYIDNLYEKARALKKTNPGQKIPHNFLIIDDCLGKVTESAWFKNFIFTHRQISCSVFLTAQYLPSSGGAGTFLRACTNYALMFNTYMSNSIKCLYNAYGGMFDDINEFKHAMKKISETKHASILFAKGGSSKESSYYSYLAPKFPQFQLKY